MKPIVAKQYPYTGDYYSYTLVTSADGTVTERRYATIPTEVRLSLSVNLLGELVIDSETKMQLAGRLKNIVDRNGEKIYDAGEWDIVQTMPVLSGLGTKEGYRYRARLIAGNI
jgi:hypothetical protein